MTCLLILWFICGKYRAYERVNEKIRTIMVNVSTGTRFSCGDNLKISLHFWSWSVRFWLFHKYQIITSLWYMLVLRWSKLVCVIDANVRDELLSSSYKLGSRDLLQFSSHVWPLTFYSHLKCTSYHWILIRRLFMRSKLSFDHCIKS